MCLVISLSLWSDLISDEWYLNWIIRMVFVYFAFDMFVTKKLDMYLHHIIVLAMIADYWSIQYPIKYVYFGSKMILPAEISSVFLGIRRVIETFPGAKNRYRILLNVNDFMFVVCFILFRLIWYVYCMFQSEFYELIHDLPYGWLKLLYLSLFMCLNIKWTYDILRIMHGKIYGKTKSE